LQGGPICAWCSPDTNNPRSSGFCSDNNVLGPSDCRFKGQGICSLSEFIDKAVTIGTAVGVTIYVVNLAAITLAAHKTVSCALLLFQIL
jgi:hypothetical protein